MNFFLMPTVQCVTNNGSHIKSTTAFCNIGRTASMHAIDVRRAKARAQQLTQSVP